MQMDENKRLRNYDRGMLRSMFVSLFASIVQNRKKSEGLTFSKLADALEINKSAVSRWFSKAPNWRLNTISDLANVLDVEITIEARDRKTGVIYTPYGIKVDSNEGQETFLATGIITAGPTVSRSSYPPAKTFTNDQHQPLAA
ncbi:MAG: hypothetical protein CMI63_07715 [Parvularcula sp.]|nr:hypothetical protein [Parvularcula sp.]